MEFNQSRNSNSSPNVNQNKSPVLVTGGAGYVGSATVHALLKSGRKVIVLDNLSTGHGALRDILPGADYVTGSIEDQELVFQLVQTKGIREAIHFAGRALVGESMALPELYFKENTAHTLAFLDAALAGGLTTLVFSSTCATYGEPQTEKLDEAHRQNPVNPYGISKLFVEQALASLADRGRLRSLALRYFNAAGATQIQDQPPRFIGEDHGPETHAIPRLIFSALGRGPAFSCFGQDYPTPDGTCLRDYVHIDDLADAHIRALSFLETHMGFDAINLGSGSGYSVMELVKELEGLLGQRVEVRTAPRRAGDPARLVANPEKAWRLLKWKASRNLKEILSSALAWHRDAGDPYTKGILLIDRDGTINQDPGEAKYVMSPDSLRLVPGVGKALAAAKRAGFRLGVVTNQACIGRGLITEQTLLSIHRRMEDLISLESGMTFRFDAIAYCPHHPDASCPCRKPSPTLLRQALTAMDRPQGASSVWMIGDHAKDLEAGNAAGCSTALVLTGHGSKTVQTLPKFQDPKAVYPSLVEALAAIIHSR